MERHWTGNDLMVKLGWDEAMSLPVCEARGLRSVMDAVVTAAWEATGLPGEPAAAEVTLDAGWVRVIYRDARKADGE